MSDRISKTESPGVPAPLVLPFPKETGRETLLSWYRENARDLPWRRVVTPYRTWVSEIMLQQTRVEAVKEYFLRFTEELPSVESLAAVPDEILLKLWQGLGYYSRARNLKKAAQQIVSEYGGRLPSDPASLRRLPGIGSYTAGAIASIAFGIPAPAVDGNVLRVLARLTGDEHDIALPVTKALYEETVRAWMPEAHGKDCGDFTQGLIELGATVCLPNGAPACARCPFSLVCVAAREQKTDLLPVKTGKATRKTEERTVLLLCDGERYALTRRPEIGLLAGLYEPVNLTGYRNDGEIRAFTESVGLKVRGVSFLGTAKHIFTHLEWHMRVYRVDVLKDEPTGELIFRTPREIREGYALPSAYRFCFPYLLQEEEGKTPEDRKSAKSERESQNHDS